MIRTSNVWWLPLARRALGWGLAGALLWALPILLILASGVAGLGLWETANTPPPDPYARNSIPFSPTVWAVMFATIISGIFLALGAIAGVIAGLCASPVDTKDPLHSRFFRCVHLQTFWVWFVTSIIGVPTFAALVYYGLNPTLRQTGIFAIGCGLAFSALLFVLALWRAVNHARTVKLSP